MNNGVGFFFGCLAIAFVVFITTRGELSRYMKAIFGIDTTGFGSFGESTLKRIGF